MASPCGSMPITTGPQKEAGSQVASSTGPGRPPGEEHGDQTKGQGQERRQALGGKARPWAGEGGAAPPAGLFPTLLWSLFHHPWAGWVKGWREARSDQEWGWDSCHLLPEWTQIWSYYCLLKTSPPGESKSLSLEWHECQGLAPHPSLSLLSLLTSPSPKSLNPLGFY